MKLYLVLCFEDRTERFPSKNVVLHENELHSIVSLLEKYVYIVVESLDSVE